MASSRQVDQRTGKTKQSSSSGEGRRDATREREIRDVKQAIDKGYRNKAIEGFYRK